MPPSLREVAWRVPRKRHDGGSHLWKGEDSLSLASLDSSLGEGAGKPSAAGPMARLCLRQQRILKNHRVSFPFHCDKLPISCVM